MFFYFPSAQRHHRNKDTNKIKYDSRITFRSRPKRKAKSNLGTQLTLTLAFCYQGCVQAAKVLIINSFCKLGSFLQKYKVRILSACKYFYLATFFALRQLKETLNALKEFFPSHLIQNVLGIKRLFMSPDDKMLCE